MIQAGGAAAMMLYAAVELWRNEQTVILCLLCAGVLLGLRFLGLKVPTGNVTAGEAAERAPAADPRPLAKGLQALQSELVEQQRGIYARGSASAAAWGDLMARVSHDMRTPLNAVIGFSDVMGSELFGPVGDDRYREYIAHIRDSGRELLRSAEDTLAITQLIGAADRQPKDALPLRELALEAVIQAGTVNADVGIEAGLDVLGDRKALKQTLVNLVAEAALRAGPEGRFSVNATTEDEFVVLQVAVADAGARRACGEASLNVCMSRVLLELQGARLIEIEQDGTWRAVTVLSLAAQQDFFLGAGARTLPAQTYARASLAN